MISFTSRSFLGLEPVYAMRCSRAPSSTPRCRRRSGGADVARSRDARVEPVAGRAMLDDIESGELLLRRNPQADGPLDGEEEQAGGHGDEDEVDHHEDQLSPQLVEATAVEQAGVLAAEECVVVAGEQCDRQGP